MQFVHAGEFLKLVDDTVTDTATSWGGMDDESRLVNLIIGTGRASGKNSNTRTILVNELRGLLSSQ